MTKRYGIEDPKIEHLEGKMLQMEQADCPVIHSFGPGIYIRELRMKAGTLAIGHYQKFEHMNILVKGSVMMLNDDGSKKVVSAPLIFTGKPGRKAGYVLEDVVWLNVYATDETDVEKLENTYLEKSETFKSFQALKQVEAVDNIDYTKMLIEHGKTDKIVREQSENKEDQIDMPYGNFKIKIADSPIEGKGIFATAKIQKSEFVGPARLEGKRTPIGRYTNHSKNSNAEMIRVGEDIYMKATKDIEGCYGGQDGEEITTNYRNNLKLLGVLPCQV